MGLSVRKCRLTYGLIIVYAIHNVQEIEKIYNWKSKWHATTPVCMHVENNLVVYNMMWKINKPMNVNEKQHLHLSLTERTHGIITTTPRYVTSCLSQSNMALLLRSVRLCYKFWAWGKLFCVVFRGYHVSKTHLRRDYVTVEDSTPDCNLLPLFIILIYCRFGATWR